MEGTRMLRAKERSLSRVCSQQLETGDPPQHSYPYPAWQTDWSLWPSEPSLSGPSHPLHWAETWRGTRPRAAQNRPRTCAHASSLCGLPPTTEHSTSVSVPVLCEEVSLAAPLRKSYASCGRHGLNSDLVFRVFPAWPAGLPLGS